LILAEYFFWEFACIISYMSVHLRFFKWMLLLYAFLIFVACIMLIAGCGVILQILSQYVYASIKTCYK